MEKKFTNFTKIMPVFINILCSFISNKFSSHKMRRFNSTQRTFKLNLKKNYSLKADTEKVLLKVKKKNFSLFM